MKKSSKVVASQSNKRQSASYELDSEGNRREQPCKIHTSVPQMCEWHKEHVQFDMKRKRFTHISFAVFPSEILKEANAIARKFGLEFKPTKSAGSFLLGRLKAEVVQLKLR